MFMFWTEWNFIVPSYCNKPTGVSVYVRCCAQLKGTSMCCYVDRVVCSRETCNTRELLIHGTEEEKNFHSSVHILGYTMSTESFTISRQVTGTFDDLKFMTSCNALSHKWTGHADICQTITRVLSNDVISHVQGVCLNYIFKLPSGCLLPHSRPAWYRIQRRTPKPLLHLWPRQMETIQNGETYLALTSSVHSTTHYATFNSSALNRSCITAPSESRETVCCNN